MKHWKTKGGKGLGKIKNENMYKLYDEYKETLQDVKKVTRKRQKINAGIRDEYKNPYRRKDYNSNKSDITNWNSMGSGLEDTIKMIEMYLDYDDRYYLHKECNDVRSMIYNQNSYEGEIPLDSLFGESIKDTTDIVTDVELQEEICELLDDVLTERQKQVIKMYYWDGMTQEKIGKKLGVSRQAINETLSKSLELLRDVCSVQYLDYL